MIPGQDLLEIENSLVCIVQNEAHTAGQSAQAITDAAREAFDNLRTAHSTEAFYAYALFTNAEANRIAASANMEEGLILRAKHYEATEKRGIKEHARMLRWSPAGVVC